MGKKHIITAVRAPCALIVLFVGLQAAGTPEKPAISYGASKMHSTKVQLANDRLSGITTPDNQRIYWLGSPPANADIMATGRTLETCDYTCQVECPDTQGGLCGNTESYPDCTTEWWTCYSCGDTMGSTCDVFCTAWTSGEECCPVGAEKDQIPDARKW